MAASGYMTEEDTELIWSTSISTAQFDKINVRIGELLNFWITGDAATDITNTAVLPIVEHLSEETLIELLGASKVTGIVIPYDWITANVSKIVTDLLSRNWRLLEKVADKLGKHHHIKYSNKLTLPSHSD